MGQRGKCPEEMSDFESASFFSQSGTHAVAGDKFAIVAAKYNEFITAELIDAAVDGLRTHGVGDGDIELYRVPGAMELPLAAKWLAQSGKFVSIICLGSVIRGATTHYEVVVEASSNGISQVALEFGIPTIFGVLTTENIEQGIERSDPRLGNKGLEFALSAIEMANLKRSILG